MAFKKTIEERLWNKVNKDGPIPSHLPELGKCWLWTGLIVRRYGQCYDDGRRKRTHRLVYELYYGKIPNGMFVCHKCDNPLCCNPSHLFLGTAIDNNKDMMMKGRGRFPGGRASGDLNGSRKHPSSLKRGDEHWTRIKKDRLCRGERSHFAKLCESEVVLIRKLSSSGLSAKEISTKLNLNESTLRKVINRKTWKHLK